MLEEMMKKFVMVKSKVPSWEEAIREAAQPLLDGAYITTNYIEKMIANVHEFGPYIVIMPRVALPHSRASDGALHTGISLMKLDEEVLFPNNKGVSLIVVLAANDDEVHMRLLGELVDVFTDDTKMEAIFQAKSRAQLLEAL